MNMHMMMHFHQSEEVWWYLETMRSANMGTFIAGCAFTAALCLIYELSSWSLRRLEDSYVAAKKEGGSAPVSTLIMLLCFNLIKQGIGYPLMLLIMTFNIILCLVIVGSRTIFSLIFNIIDDCSGPAETKAHDPFTSTIG